MPRNTFAETLVGAGFPYPVAEEIDKQTGDQVGEVNPLLAIGVPVAQAVEIKRAIDTATPSGPKLVAAGMNPVQAAVFAKNFPVPPKNTVLPAVTGALTVGSTLTTTDGTWTPAGVTFAYVWTRNSITIAGATNKTYVLVAADVGATIRAGVIGTVNGMSVQALSNSVGPVVAA